VVKSNASRQAAYRNRHLRDEHGNLERINQVVSLHAKRALERLAKCYGVTQRGLLEKLLLDAEKETVNRVSIYANGQADYYDSKFDVRTATLRSNGQMQPFSLE
jgi:hypothetical protein